MKRVLVTGAGGSPAVNFTRSLRKAPEPFFLVGTDADKFYLMRAETDARYLVPLARDADYLAVLNQIIDREKIELVHAQNDAEVSFLSQNREKLHAKTFLPAKETVKTCQDKFLSFERWSAAGIKVPRTRIVKTHEDVQRCLDEFGGKMWIRATSGAGGRGSLPVSDVDTAVNWLNFQKGWDGTFTASELLEKDSITWMSIWNEGSLVVAQGRRRLYWELSKLSPSGVTGATGAGETVSDPVLDDIAQRAIVAVDARPHGLFAVDLTYDANGVPNPTEINIGRFFTTHQFFTELGVNMPFLYVKLAYGEELPKLARTLNPADDHMVWIRGIDFEPVLCSMAEVEANVAALKALRSEIHRRK
jgi:carbamoyl-phosphate synthase large subunit